MNSFALTAIYPRSIAWLVWQGDTEWLEKIIKYNCAILGGYFNIIIPVVELGQDKGEISEDYIKFMEDYDPDLVILPPGANVGDISLSPKVQPFLVVIWDQVPQIITSDTLNICPNIDASNLIEFRKKPCISVFDDNYPQMSRMSFVLCGDLEPSILKYEKIED